ncbi:MAG: hypothetical protein O3A00_25460 [Planctomycetota bacterium]|nr:hypothetical protein [Planctomycetota bacterium]
MAPCNTRNREATLNPTDTNPRSANENGDVESGNGHIKDQLDQALPLRGSRDFASRDESMSFAELLCEQ